MTNFDELIPEMREWNNGDGIDVAAWIGCTGNFQLAVGNSVIFWTRFVEFEGYDLREGFSLEILRDCETKCSRDRKAIEAVLNHLHIADIQYHGCEDISRERIVYLGRVLREIYEAKLAWQFPQRRFEVHLYEAETDDLLEYEITFFQSA